MDFLRSTGSIIGAGMHNPYVSNLVTLLILNRIAWLGTVQLLYIQYVLLPSTGELISDEVVARDNGSSNFAVDESLDSILPGLIECDAINTLQDVNPCWRLGHLKGGAIRKVRWAQTIERCSVLSKGAKHRLAVFLVGSDKDIQVFGCSRFCVNAESIATHDKILNRVIVERAQQLF